MSIVRPLSNSPLHSLNGGAWRLAERCLLACRDSELQIRYRGSRTDARRERNMRGHKAIFWLALSMMYNGPADASVPGPHIEGQWTTEYQIVDVSNSIATNPNALKALKMWIGHRYGSSNCVSASDTSNLLRSAYPWDIRSKSVVSFDEYGGFRATNRYWGGFAIPGHGTETIVGAIDGDHLNGIVDIDLDWEGGTHVRSVLRATRSGPCK